MDNPVIEIRDEEINVEEIMRTIRENIRRRKEAGLLPDDPEQVSSSAFPASFTPSDCICDLSYLKSNYDIQNNCYNISSHRPYFGKYLIQGRSLVHGEVRRYIDPVIWKQTEFNRNTIRALDSINTHLSELNHIITRIGEIDSVKNHINDLDSKTCKFAEIDSIKIHIDELDNITNRITEIDSIKNRIGELDNITSRITEIDSIKSHIDELDNITTRINEIDSIKIHIDELDNITDRITEIDSIKNRIGELESTFLAFTTDIENKTWLAQVLEKRISNPKSFESERDTTSAPPDLGFNYFVFEDRFRGSRSLIKNRQTAFLKYFEGCRNVLDIGCGRGEFLELMKEQGIGARGVDLDETMVDYCRMRGLEVELKDAISYLEGLEDGSLDGIFIDQVVEHLEPGYLIHLLQLCHQKMQYGFYLVAETVNPLSFFSFANFYIDLNHVRPVHPETLRFLFDNAGFQELEANFLSPVTDEARLQKFPSDWGRDDEGRRMVEVYNRNVEMLNGILYGAQDYSVVGKK
jgi:O-antigen chain-terminating methyltransferase